MRISSGRLGVIIGTVILAVPLALIVGLVQGPIARAGNSQEVVATVSGAVVTGSALEAVVSRRLIGIRTQEFNVKWNALKDLISRQLIKREAERRGLQESDLIRLEVDARVAPVSEQELRAVYESSREQFRNVDPKIAYAQISSHLQQRRVAERRKSFLDELKAKAAVSTYLEPPRVAVATTGPSLGEQDAAVTIVEFSDFQCPYCAQARVTLAKLVAAYKGKVRLVFRDFPLEIHHDAPKAAEASRCAAEKGKFWEMHDKLFDNQQRLLVSDLIGYASEIGLDPSRFRSCLESGRYAPRVQADKLDGQSYGVSGTPALFVNGVFVAGAGSYDALAGLIEDELVRGVQHHRSSVGTN